MLILPDQMRDYNITQEDGPEGCASLDRFGPDPDYSSNYDSESRRNLCQSIDLNCDEFQSQAAVSAREKASIEAFRARKDAKLAESAEIAQMTHFVIDELWMDLFAPDQSECKLNQSSLF